MDPYAVSTSTVYMSAEELSKSVEQTSPKSRSYGNSRLQFSSRRLVSNGTRSIEVRHSPSSVVLEVAGYSVPNPLSMFHSKEISSAYESSRLSGLGWKKNGKAGPGTCTCEFSRDIEVVLSVLFSRLPFSLPFPFAGALLLFAVFSYKQTRFFSAHRPQQGRIELHFAFAFRQAEHDFRIVGRPNFFRQYSWCRFLERPIARS